MGTVRLRPSRAESLAPAGLLQFSSIRSTGEGEMGEAIVFVRKGFTCEDMTLGFNAPNAQPGDPGPRRRR